MHFILTIFIAGALGGLCKDIFKDNSITLPNIKEGKIFLGFLGGMIIGGAAGMYIDGGFVTAFMGGFTGTAILEGVLNNKTPLKKSKKQSVEQIIRVIARKYGVDENLAVRVAKAESDLNPTARNVNKTGSIDRGLYQINNICHPEVTDEQADDIVFATRFFCKAVKENHLSWWNSSKKNWDLTKK